MPLDLDEFKHINDTRGHAAGDRVLAAVGQPLSTAVRDTDLVARWGGEEFVVAYTITDVPGALSAAERLREAIERIMVSDERGVQIRVTASLGLAVLRPGETLEQLLHRADGAMYASKAAGRNRVTAHGEDSARAAV